MTDAPPAAAAPAPPPATGWRASLAVYAERPVAIMLGLGFAAGLPNFLVFDTLSAWLRAAGLSLAAISLFSLATLPYSFKFLWAPLVDRVRLPWLTARLGHRRSWMILAQVAIIAGLAAISAGDPRRHLTAMAIVALAIGFASATQDIVIDAWRIEAVDAPRQGAMAAAYQWGYRVANIVAGAAPLLLAERFGWRIAYLAMAGAMSLGLLAVLLAPREADHRVRPIDVEAVPAAPALETAEWALRLAVLVLGAALLACGLGANAELIAGVLRLVGERPMADALTAAWTAKPNGVWLQLGAVVTGFAVIAAAAASVPGVRTRPGLYLRHALGDPLADFFRRYGRRALLILALICLYRLSDFVLNLMNAFYLDLGFTLGQIAEVRKVFGVAASLLGVFLGGVSIARLGVMRSLVIGAVALPVTNTIFGWLAVQGPQVSALLVAIGLDNIVSSYAGTCLIAYMSGLTGAGFTATQYALFSSLYSLPGKLLASQSGRIVEAAARSAQAGGLVAPLTGLFAHAPPKAFAAAMAKSHVTPAALGAGYVAFFLYAGLVGVAAMVLAWRVAASEPVGARVSARRSNSRQNGA